MKTFLLVLLASASAWAAPHALLLPAVGTPNQVTVRGRVWVEAPEPASNVLEKNLDRLMARNLEGVTVELSFAHRAVRTVSGHDGEFEATFQALKGPALESGTVVATIGGGRNTAPVLIVSASAPFLVVSDFDDTVAVTGVTSKRALIKSSLFQDGTTQPVVPGMADLYRCLRTHPVKPGLLFVSGSPVQYAPRVLAFLDRHDFLSAGLSLRNLGPSTLSGYKQPALRELLKTTPWPVVLIGDSGEHDPEVYAQLRGEFPQRVKRIYIRNAGGELSSKRLTDMVLFADPRDAARDAVEKGLADPACVKAAFGAAQPEPSATPSEAD